MASIDWGDGTYAPPASNTVPGKIEWGQNVQAAPAQIQQQPGIGWAQVPGLALSNLPDSAASAVEGLFHTVRHPLDTASSLLDIAAGSLRNALPSSVSGALDTADWNPAASQHASNVADLAHQGLANRYGGIEQFKRTLATDPVGVAMDLSTALAGASGLAHGVAGLGGAGDAGDLLPAATRAPTPEMGAAADSAVSRALVSAPEVNPGSVAASLQRGSVPAFQGTSAAEDAIARALAGNSASVTPSVAQAPTVAQRLGSMIQQGAQTAAGPLQTASKYTNPMSLISPAASALSNALVKPVLGLGTGTGAENIGQSFLAGQNADQSFLNNYLGNGSMTDVLQQAKQGLQNMRLAKSAQYQQGIGTTAADTTKLDFSPIDAAFGKQLDTLKQNGHWIVGDDQLKPVQQLADVLDEWRGDPNAQTAIGLDGLKRRIDEIYPENNNYGQAQRVVSNVRNAVKDTIVDQSPEYAKTMSDYENSLNLEKEIQSALIGGDKASQDTAMRKLQSLSRNNVQTNYGNRLDLANALQDQGGVSILPAIAGQAMNSWQGRGLTGHGGNIATLLAGMHNPAVLAALPFQSPKVVGGVAYGLGAATRPLMEVGVTPQNAAMAALLAAQAGKATSP
jgi:hypothetical protein